MSDIEWLSHVEATTAVPNPESPIVIRRYTGAATLPVAQRHDCFELNYQSKGTVVNCIGSTRVRRLPGTVSMIAPDVPHLGIELEGPHDSIVVHFLPDVLLDTVAGEEGPAILERFMRGTTAHSAIVDLPAAAQRPVQAALQQMLREEKARQFGWRLALRARLIDVLLVVTRWERTTRRRPPPAHVPEEWHALERALKHLHANFNEKVYARDLAAAVGMSETRLKALFRKTIRTPWVQYLQAYRIHRASLLLLGTARTVTEVAMDVGFDNPGHFSEIFRRHMGTTPSRYRSQSRRKVKTYRRISEVCSKAAR